MATIWYWWIITPSTNMCIAPECPHRSDMQQCHGVGYISHSINNHVWKQILVLAIGFRPRQSCHIAFNAGIITDSSKSRYSSNLEKIYMWIRKHKFYQWIDFYIKITAHESFTELKTNYIQLLQSTPRHIFLIFNGS